MDDFFSQGEGYIGINMEDVFVTVPGDPNQRVGIRVGIVMKDSAASDAGLQVGDVIVGLGDEIWREIPIREKFGRQIRELKPKSKVNLKVFRGGKLVDIDVTLRRRPPIPMGLPLLDDSPVDLEALLKAEQEEFFRNWLKAKQLKK